MLFKFCYNNETNKMILMRALDTLQLHISEHYMLDKLSERVTIFDLDLISEVIKDNERMKREMSSLVVPKIRTLIDYLHKIGSEHNAELII